MSFLRCGLFLIVLSHLLFSFAVAQNACLYSPDRNGICRSYADCKELHGQLIFQNPACKANTFCCPNNFITPPLSNNLEPEANPDYENPPLADEIIENIWNDVPWLVGNSQPNPNFNNNWNPKSDPEVQVNPIYASIKPPIDFSRHPAAGQNIGNSQPNFNNNWNQKSSPKSGAPVNPNIETPWGEKELINSSIDDSTMPVDRYRNDTWGQDEPKNPTKVLPINLPLDSPEILENQEANFNVIQTTRKPITTTTEAIPIFDEEFYRRLGLAFGNEYNIYNRQDVVTAENDVEEQTVNIVIEEVSTNSSHFMNNLNQLGLHKLSLEKCGFVHVQNDPSQSNVQAHLLEFPWLALLRYEGESKIMNFSCGGALITERWVLTAASCIRKSLIGVRLGEYELSEKSNKNCVPKSSRAGCKDYKIANMVKHPEYKPETGIKDIALIKLKGRAQRSKNIKTICLPTNVEYFNVPYNKTPLTITGWGLNKAGATKIMKKHAINRSKLQLCHQANPTQLVHHSKLCLATRHEKSSTCSGDPGGPVSWIVDDGTKFVTQIGIVPFGMDKCGAANGVVSNYYVESVADSMDWITKVIGED